MRLSKLLTSGLPAFALAAFLVQTPEAQASRWEETTNALDGRIQRIERLLDSQGLQEMYQRLEILDQENRTLRGEVEQLSFRLESVLDRNRQMYLEMDQRMQALENGASAAAVSGDPNLDASQAGGVDTGIAVPETPSVSASQDNELVVSEGESEESAYRAAFELLKQRNFNGAISGFETFLRNYSASPLAANAQYWLGEAAYGSGAFQRASLEFERVLNNYASSPKADDAALKLGYAYYELQQYAKARTVLQDLMMRSSGSTVGKLAAERLKRMKREGR